MIHASVRRTLSSCRHLLSFAFFVLLALPATAQVQLPALGGPGGGTFVAQCPAGQILRGFDLRTGDDVASLRPVCGVASRPDGVAGEAAVGPFHGDGGGTPVRIACPLAVPAVIGMTVMDEGQDTDIVNAIQLSCGLASDIVQPGRSDPSASFAGPIYKNSDPIFFHFSASNTNSQACPPGQIAIGAHGRSGVWLDAVGLICGAAPFSHVRSIGRGTPVGTPAKRRTICAQAADAEKRNSPFAPQLRAACNASKH